MVEGYIICEQRREMVEGLIRAKNLKYDENLSKLINKTVFWYESNNPPREETLQTLKGVFVALEEIIVAGLIKLKV